ncbi:MAG: dienelactone hydrolase family protein [Rhodospirillaceae bacterium]|nr:dienelactone hydrolase family protein [Rhodospirillaceae bacterium]
MLTRPLVSQAVINLYDEYTHAPLPRRVFMDRLTKLAGSTAAAQALLPLLENNYALAEVVPPNDTRISTSDVSFESPVGTVKGYLALPKDASKKTPAVVVIHENRGLTPHIKDVARRLAVAGYIGLAPDGVSILGGTPDNEDQVREMFAKLDLQKAAQEFIGAVNYLASHPRSTGKVGCVGFCWGGTMANQLAVSSDKLAAVVPFYGRQPDTADVPKIKAPLLLHYAGNDERIDAGITAFEAALKANGKSYELHMYDGAQHAFHNDTAPTRYDEKSATLAWSRTLKFFAKHLKG